MQVCALLLQRGIYLELFRLILYLLPAAQFTWSSQCCSGGDFTSPTRVDVYTGTPFFYPLENDTKVLSVLPPWITISDQPQALNAVPLLSDLEYAAGQNYSLKFPTCLNLDSEPTIRVCLERSSVRAGHDSQCWQLWIRVRSAWCTWMPAALPKLQVLVQNECTNRQPLLVAVELAIRQSYLRADRRPTLWRRLQHHLAGPTGSQSELKPLSGENFHILDVDLQLHRTVNVLARAHTAHQIGNWSGLNITDFKTLRAIWTMGCGFLNEDALRMLMRLEERFIISPIIDKWLLEPGQPGPIQGVLLDWLVGDYQDPRPEGRVRSRRQSAGFQEYSPIFASRVAGAVSEASGMTPPEHIATGSFLKPDLTSVEGSQKLQLEQPLAPIEITVHQISNARIPPNTFTGPPNSRLRLRLFEHVYPMQFGVDAEASVGREIHRDINNWVSFDSTNEIIRIRPFPEHVGNHNFVLCAYDETDAKVCAPLEVKVRSTSPIKKSFILQVPPGIFWCNQIPLYWFEELKMESLDDIELTLTGDSPFSWSQKSRQLCVITKLRNEQIMTFFFRGNNQLLSQVVEVEFRISVKVPPTEKLLCSPRVHLKLRWTDNLVGYEAREISRLNASLAQALRIRVNPIIIPQNIFFYDIIQLRNFAERQMTAASVWLEMELVYLPLGLPDASTAETLGLLEQLMERPDSRPYLTHLAERQRFGRLLSLCENARLDGCVSAVQAAADSFHPFVVEEVGVLPVDGGACERAFMLEKKLYNGSERSLPPAGSTSMAAGSGGGGEEEKALAGFFPSPVVPFADQVIENFTVEAGLAFKKLISPVKVVPIRRIRAIEIVDETNTKVNDSSWLKVSNDHSHLFGLPLQQHIREGAYRFWLNILTVDQRTPITIHFTVDVVKWPAKIFSFSRRPNWFPGVSATANHRVRMRLKLANQFAHVQRQAAHNWPLGPPHSSLLYRWKLVTSLDKYLRPSCEANCGMDIMLLEISEQGSTDVEAIWAQLSLLSEGIRMNEPYSMRDGGGNGSVAAFCPLRRMEAFQRSLLKAPLSHRHPNLLAPPAPSSFLTANDLRPAPWALPSHDLKKHLEVTGLGSLEVVAVDLAGHCVVSNWVDRDGGTALPLFRPLLNFTTYIGESFRKPLTMNNECSQGVPVNVRLFDKSALEVKDTSWINLEPNKCAIYGVVLKSAVSAGFHEFRLMGSSPVSTVSRIFVEVLERNPRLPEVPNHRVLLRFEAAYAVRSDIRTHMLQTLSRKWLFLLTLDGYLRPECNGKPACTDELDILLINIATSGDSLNVIWAKKSLVYLKEKGEVSSWPSDNARMRRQVNYEVAQRRSVRSSAAAVAGGVHLDQDLTCPWAELAKLTQRLLVDYGNGVQTLPELVNRFSAAGFGKLIEVKVEKLGPCALPQPFEVEEPHLDTQVTSPTPFSSHLPELTDYEAEHFPEPVQSLLPLKETDSAKHQQQRDFLLTTLLPICAFIILVLMVTLVVIWFLKFRGSSKTTEKRDVAAKEAQEPLAMTEDGWNGKKNGITSKADMNHDKTLSTDDTDGLSPHPSKPLIFPNEKPPLKPPDILNTMNKNIVHSPESQLQPRPVMPSTHQINMRPYYAMGPRPDPYRNLPPPIDSRFGLPRQMTPTFGYYRRDPAV